jgi:hypothetical protein
VDPRFTIGAITGYVRRKPWHDGKIVYATFADAQRALIGMHMRAFSERGGLVKDLETLDVYDCREGGTPHFHLGRSRRRIDHEKKENGKGETRCP